MSRSGIFRPENLRQNALAMVRNICFSLCVTGALIFIIMTATYEPDDPMFHSDSTFKSDNSVVKTSEDLLASNETAFEEAENRGCNGKVDSIDCGDPDVFHLLMRAAIEKFRDIDFYQFGRPVRGINDTSCHMAWRFRPKEGNAAAFEKDFRNFVLVSENCTLSVVGIGDYHSGVNAMKRKRDGKDAEKGEFGRLRSESEAIEETVDISLPGVELDGSFSRGKYLVYSGGGDRCKTMQHFLYSFNCMLGEAQYLNRTLVLDFSICLPSIYTSSGQDEDGKDFRFYFDIEHLKDSASLLDQAQFWSEWNKRREKDGLTLHLVEDSRTTPMKLAGVEDALIMRKFGTVEPDNYWYRVCEGETDKVISRPWHMVWKSRSLLDVASAIAMRMDWDFDAIHIERGKKAMNKEQWPNLDRDTSPEALLVTLQGKIEAGRNLYISTNEPNTSFFDPLKAKYSTHFLDEFKDLWDEDSDWYAEMKKLNNDKPVELDGYMRMSIEDEVLSRAKNKIETFNDLTKDCKDGVNKCTSAS
ncbi:uncharacterized protein LOC111372360 [Olea europaea var. sylvestris]|uniref:uncharacterized protein LOC111372360 n=1 Tax=Olea europaea var. sylvestris TaxID=158386 RepID=UPI000C1D0606|nr:uncharacterized protein LOC111372360 [Olea europaea var. sylvestris]